DPASRHCCIHFRSCEFEVYHAGSADRGFQLVARKWFFTDDRPASRYDQPVHDRHRNENFESCHMSCTAVKLNGPKPVVDIRINVLPQAFTRLNEHFLHLTMPNIYLTRTVEFYPGKRR